jgi:transposase-like protein
MGRIRSKFEPDFKLRIVHGIMSSEQSQSSIAREYGIATSVIRNWVERFSNQEHSKDRPSAAERHLLDENRQLKEKLAELYMQVELLKKVPSFVQAKKSANSFIVTSSSLAQSQVGANDRACSRHFLRQTAQCAEKQG